MNDALVLTEIKGSVAVLTINRPEKLNALNDATLDALDAALDRVEEREEILTLVLTGAGEKAFIAGADIGEIARLDPMKARTMALKGQRLTRRMETFPKVIIAAVNGFALGGGCELAMACHIRLASENAMFGQPEVKLGIIPGYGGTQRLPRLVGKGWAMELCLAGGMIDARKAEEIGLVNHVYPAPDLLNEALKLADTIASRAPVAVRFAQESITQGLDMPFEQACHLEAHLFATLFSTQDREEGTKAFLEKRKPEFKGK